MQTKINKLENQIACCQSDLNILIQSTYNSNVNPKINEAKIKALQAKINSLNEQLNIIKNDLQLSQNMSIQKDNKYNQQINVPVYTQSIQQTNQVHPATYQQTKSNNEIKHNIESAIGKNIMGIAASILIFISIILFATLLYPFLNDTIKLLSIYTISIALLSFGLIKSKNKSNKIYTIFIGCGMGALYISLFLTNIYFKLINDIILFILLFIWSIGILILSKIKTIIFQFIGHIGILISVIAGCILCVQTYDINKFIVLTIFYIVSNLMFYISNVSKDYKTNIISNIFNIISTLILYNVSYDFSNNISILIILSVYNILLLIVNLYITDKQSQNSVFSIINGIMFIIISKLFVNIFTNPFNTLFIAILSVIYFILLEIKHNQKTTTSINILEIILILYCLPMCYSIDIIKNSICLALIIIPLLIYSFINNNNILKYTAISLIFIYCIPANNSIPFIIFGLLIFSVIVFLLLKEEMYSPIIKNLTYAQFLLFICTATDKIVDNNYFLITFTIISIINILATKTFMIKNWKTYEDEKAGYIFTSLINSILMFVSLLLITFDNSNEIHHLIYILVAIGVYLINTKNLLEKYPYIITGFYVCGKITLLTLVILNSFDVINYLISITCLIIAIISIILGFRFKFKSFRLYGLALSFISIFKLLMLDMTYNNTLGYAISFFIAGVLCFVISIIYNKLDNQLSKE